MRSATNQPASPFLDTLLQAELAAALAQQTSTAEELSKQLNIATADIASARLQLTASEAEIVSLRQALENAHGYKADGAIAENTARLEALAATAVASAFVAETEARSARAVAVVAEARSARLIEELAGINEMFALERAGLPEEADAVLRRLHCPCIGFAAGTGPSCGCRGHSSSTARDALGLVSQVSYCTHYLSPASTLTSRLIYCELGRPGCFTSVV